MAYKPKKIFALHNQTHPNQPHSGADLDREFQAIETNLTQQEQDIADIRRPDGQLKNGIVTPESLAPNLATNLTGNIEDKVTPWVSRAEGAATQAQNQASQAEAHATQAATQANRAATHAAQAQTDRQTATDAADDAQSFAAASFDSQKSAADSEQAADTYATQAQSYQAGAQTAYADAKQAADTAMAAVGPAAAHIHRTDNPHKVTHDQVQSNYPHWNASHIMGKAVSVDNRKADGLQRVVVWDPAKDTYTHAVFSALAGGGLKYPINWANEGEGRILVLRDDGNGGFVWVLEPKPQKGKKGVNEFVDLADTPAVIEAGKALIGHDENGLKSLIWTEIYTKLEIDGLLVPINSRLDQLQLLFSQLQDRLDLQDSKITDLINQITNIETRLTQIENNNQQGGGNTQITQNINKARAANRWHVWAGI